ncbi:MAG TPA: hypothetical protein VFM07_10905 [Intrasporangium sp.]|nr:hypothetical protein [Intrasporangium sp.]
MGRFGPLVAITSFDQAPVELTWQTPVNGELYRLVPGPDRPDYSIMVLERPVHFYPPERFDVARVPAGRRVPDRRGRPMVRVDALVVCSRFVGQQLHPGMKDLPVNVAYVIDESALTDPSLDFGKIEYAAVGSLTEGRIEREPDPGSAPAREAAVPDEDDDDRTLTEAARVLREGVEGQRGGPVQHLTATLTLDDAGQVVGLTGVADGTPPVPTPETFERLSSVLAGLRTQAGPRLEALEVRVAGDEVTCEARHRS